MMLFSQIPLKEPDGWIDIGAVVRLAPIKDIKTMLYSFYELAQQVPNVRLHIMGGIDDQEYADECFSLVKTRLNFWPSPTSTVASSAVPLWFPRSL